MEGGSQAILELSSATLGKENLFLGKESFVGSKILQSMSLGDQKTKSQAAAEDLLDQLSDQSKNIDTEIESQGWQSPKSKKRRKARRRWWLQPEPAAGCLGMASQLLQRLQTEQELGTL
jgi:predicted Zn-dependent peptidase